MPGGDGRGLYGTFTNYTDPATGLGRPLYRYRYGGYIQPLLPAAAPPAYPPPRPPTHPSYYGYVPRGYPYGGYGNPKYWNRGLGYGLGPREGRGQRGR